MKNTIGIIGLLLTLLIYGCVDTDNNPYQNHPILVKEKEFCPKFEDCEFRENYILLDTCKIELNNWKLRASTKQFETDEYKTLGSGSFASKIPIVESHPSATCEKGLLTGQNINSYYCSIQILKKPVIDENGTILSTSLLKTINAEYDITSKKLIKQSCFNSDGYE